MSAPASLSPVTLTSCDAEPIHILGAIQPFGFLLSVNADWLVVRASENVQGFLGASHEQVCGHPARNVLSENLVHDIRSRLQVAGGVGVVERLFGQRLVAGGARFDIAVHQSGAEVVIEFEPSGAEPTAPLAVLRTMTARIERQSGMPAVYREVARQVRGLTGFDRVMLYRFDEEGAGEVVAESATHGMPPFLGLRYPASDIPVQARALYERNFLRLIADVDAKPVAILPALSPEGHALDLSMSGLRSVSPIHIEYLRNMGVRTSMSISVLQRGKLWGVIACHHGTAKHINLEVRSTAELFGQMFSYLLETRLGEDDAAYDAQTKAIHDSIAFAFAEPNASLANMPEFLAGAGDFIQADGIGVYNAGEIRLTGITPTREEFLQIVTFLNKTASGRVFSTHKLGDIFPPAADYVMRAAGLVSIPISRMPRDYLVFFRRETGSTVTWAGEPLKTEGLGPNGPRLTPRKSFEAWQETVRHQSTRWSARELRAAESLRVTLIELALRMTETVQADFRVSQQSQEILIAELNHRVRNILGLVRGLVNQSAASASDMRAFVEGLDDRIGSLARAHDHLSSNNNMPASLQDLMRFKTSTYSELENRLTLSGPDVLLEPKAFTAMALVIHELVTNARKYGALSTPEGRISIKTSVDDVGSVAVTWSESGGPIVAKPIRRGFGSTLIEQLIPFEMSGISKPNFLPLGFELDMLLPAAVAQAVAPRVVVARLATGEAMPADAVQLSKLLHTTLVVEDNLFIALDAEDMLRALGAQKVVVANSIAEARNAIAGETFSFALVDVNLGTDNSLPIARLLLAAKVPFAFGTGYGERLALPEAMAKTPIVSKPYDRVAMTEALMRLMAARPATLPAAQDQKA